MTIAMRVYPEASDDVEGQGLTCRSSCSAGNQVNVVLCHHSDLVSKQAAEYQEDVWLARKPPAVGLEGLRWSQQHVLLLLWRPPIDYGRCSKLCPHPFCIDRSEDAFPGLR